LAVEHEDCLTRFFGSIGVLESEVIHAEGVLQKATVVTGFGGEFSLGVVPGSQ